MECKGSSKNMPTQASMDWNISRMECKVALGVEVKDIREIGIYPEWNVKKGDRLQVKINSGLEYIQNGM